MPYVRKTSDIHISDEMNKVLRQMEDNSEVARLLLRQRHPVETLIEDHVDYISISKSDKTKVSYLPKDRMDKVEDGEYWHTSKRFNVKPGAFVSKVFVNISEKEVEKFATLFKNIQNTPDFTFKVVDGQDILKYYHYESYADQSSSLGASCMKHVGCQDFLNIYVDNPDKIKMLIMLNRDNYLIGRALLWSVPMVMDRIYTINDDEYSYHFKKWADDNGYMYKREQKWNNTLFFESKGKATMIEMSVSLNSVYYRRYPYFDTFKFISIDNKTLYNYIPSDISVRTLSTPDGSSQPADFLVRDGKTNLFHHFHDTIFVDHVGYRTIPNNTYYSDVNNQNIMKEDAKFDEDLNDYIFIDDSKNNQERIKERMDYLRKRQEEREKREKTAQSTKKNSIHSIFDRYFSSSDIERFLSEASIQSMYRSYQQNETTSESTAEV